MTEVIERVMEEGYTMKEKGGGILGLKGVVDGWHVSLSRTVVVLHHWMDVLVQEVAHNLAPCCRCTLQLGRLETYCNDEKTRTFIGLKVHRNDELMSYLRAIDKSLQSFNLPTYYEEPSFHVSVLWALGDVRERVVEGGMLQCAQAIFDEHFGMHPRMKHINVHVLTLKIGNKVFTFKLLPE